VTTIFRVRLSYNALPFVSLEGSLDRTPANHLEFVVFIFGRRHSVLIGAAEWDDLVAAVELERRGGAG
jgi:hypothetical protein